MVQENHMQVHFDAKSVNEGLARMVVTATVQVTVGVFFCLFIKK